MKERDFHSERAFSWHEEDLIAVREGMHFEAISSNNDKDCTAQERECRTAVSTGHDFQEKLLHRN